MRSSDRDGSCAEIRAEQVLAIWDYFSKLRSSQICHLVDLPDRMCRNMFEHGHTGNMKFAAPQTNSTAESAGQKLTSAVLADLEMQDLEPDAREVELLARAAKAADRIEHLEAIVASEGETFRNKSGVVFPSPLLAEIRLQDGILMQALRGIKMEPAKTPAGKDAAKSRAGQASWRARQARAIPIGGIK